MTEDIVVRDNSQVAELTQVNLFESLRDIEQKRIESQDRRTAVTSQAIEATNVADQRQYDYHVEKLRRDDEDRKDRHKSGVKFAWALFIAAAVFIGLFFTMVFFGNDTQQTMATEILRTVGTGLGGFGICWFLLSGFQRILPK